MIITVTLNPALDRTLEIPKWRQGEAIRARLVARIPAGKGMNVAVGMAKLVPGVVATGLVGGGEIGVFRRELRRAGAACEMVKASGVTRENTSVIDLSAGIETHLREAGFEVSRRELAALKKRLLALLDGRSAERPLVVFSGSLPPGVEPPDFVDMLELCRGSGARLIVDANGPALKAAWETGALYAVKPNELELAELTGREPAGTAAMLKAARAILEKVELVLLTLGAKGAWAVTREKTEHASLKLKKSELVNTVGCGDAFLAGYLAAAERERKPGKALMGNAAPGGRPAGRKKPAFLVQYPPARSRLARLATATAAAAACACSPTATGYTKQLVDEMLKRVRVRNGS